MPSSVRPKQTTPTNAVRMIDFLMLFPPLSIGATKRPRPVLEKVACPLVRSIHREDDAEPRLAAQHAIVAGSGLFERERLDHGSNPGEGTKVQRVFRVSGAP